jgi:hypothetical protein
MAPDYAAQRAIGPGRMRSGKFGLWGHWAKGRERRMSMHGKADSNSNTLAAVRLSQKTAKTVRFYRDNEPASQQCRFGQCGWPFPKDGEVRSGGKSLAN